MRIRIGDWEVDGDRPIGEGAMGVVYLGRHVGSGMTAAIKVLRPGLSDDEENRARFFREARILTEVKSPHLVPVYDSGEHEGRPYLAMEFIDGAGLHRLLAAERTAPFPVAVEVALQSARGLVAAHARGIVHRDVKPGNLLIDRQGRTKVMDLGVAQWTEEASLTRLGESHGTPSYMSPEQAAASGSVTAASDVYSLGAVLYQALTGTPPFVGPTAAVLNGHMNLEPEHPCDRSPGIPEPLGDLVMAFLSKLPEHRPADPVGALEALGMACGEPFVRQWILPILERKETALESGPCSAGAALAPVSTAAVATRTPRGTRARPRRRAGGRSRIGNWLRGLTFFRLHRPAAALGGVAGVSLLVLAFAGLLLARIAALRPASIAPGPWPSGPAASGKEKAADGEAPFDPKSLPTGWTHLGVNEQGCHEVVRPMDGAVMIWIPGGTFLMGSPAGRGEDVERPQRRIRLGGYLIDKHEVTWDRYAAFCAATGRDEPARPSWARGDHPVVGISWADASAYAAWVGCDLPTEAQWEKAARGAEGAEYPWGDHGPVHGERHYCNHATEHGDEDGYSRSSPIAAFPWGASPYGVADMSGNVWEWCRDWYDPNSYGIALDEEPQGPETGDARVVRGGSWSHGARHLRAAHRGRGGPEWSAEYLGFRCAKGTAAPAKAAPVNTPAN